MKPIQHLEKLQVSRNLLEKYWIWWSSSSMFRVWVIFLNCCYFQYRFIFFSIHWYQKRYCVGRKINNAVMFWCNKTTSFMLYLRFLRFLIFLSFPPSPSQPPINIHYSWPTIPPMMGSRSTCPHFLCAL